MAAQSLTKQAAKLGIELKIENQGAAGVTNRLKSEDIKRADVVIFAADIGVVERERFEGKKILWIKTPEAIAKPQQVFEKAEALLG